MQRTLAILCEEEEYARLLMEYMNQVEAFPFQAVAFTKFEYLKEYKRKIDILLFTKEFMNAPIESLNISICYCLVESPSIQKITSYRCIPVYQKAASLINQLTGMLTQDMVCESDIYLKPSTIIYGFFSFESPSKQFKRIKDFLITKQKEEKILFISFNPFLLLPEQTNLGETSWSDVIYLLKQNNRSVADKVLEQVRSYQGISYLVGVEHYNDLSELTQEDIRCLFDMIRDSMQYTMVCIDIPIHDKNRNLLIQECDKVYQLQVADTQGNAMEKEFSRQMNLKDSEMLKKVLVIKEEIIGNSKAGVAEFNH